MTKLTVMIMAMVLLALGAVLPVGAAAHMGDVAVPYWTNISQVTKSFDATDGIGCANGSIVGKFGTTNVKAEVLVYIQTSNGWEYLGGDSSDVDGMSTTVNYQFTPVLNASYKAEFTFTATKSGTTETTNETLYMTYTGN